MNGELRAAYDAELRIAFGVAVGDRREILGQLSRILAANTGRANVSAMRPMAVPDDLRGLLD